jgi:hypothetical protein
VLYRILDHTRGRHFLVKGLEQINTGARDVVGEWKAIDPWAISCVSDGGGGKDGDSEPWKARVSPTQHAAAPASTRTGHREKQKPGRSDQGLWCPLPPGRDGMQKERTLGDRQTQLPKLQQHATCGTTSPHSTRHFPC